MSAKSRFTPYWGFAVSGLLTALLLRCGTPTPPEKITDDDVSFTIQFPAPDTLGQYQLGSEITVTFPIYASHLVSSVSATFSDLCGNSITVDSSFTSESLNDTIRLSHTPDCGDTLMVVVSLTLQSGITLTDSTHVIVRGTTPEIDDYTRAVQFVSEGEACTLFVSANGMGTISYQWYRGALALTGETDSLLVFDAVTADDSGSYTCRATSKWGEDVSVPMTIRVTLLNAPNAPENLRIVQKQLNQVSLSWAGVSGVDGYRVYRDTIEYGTSVPLDSLIETFFVDSVIDLSGRDFYYWATSRKDGLESQPSGSVLASRIDTSDTSSSSEIDTTLLLTLERINTDSVLLSWDSISSAATYRVYHSPSRTGVGYTQTTQTVDTFFIFQTVNTYHYYVAAEDESGTTYYSDTVAGTTQQIAPSWVTDTIRATIVEGEVLTINLHDSCDTGSSAAIAYELVNPSPEVSIVDDSVFTFTAGNRDSGAYYQRVIAEASALADTVVIFVTVSPTSCTLTLTPPQNGSADSNPAGTAFRWGDTVTVTASPGSGYEFDHWTGDVSSGSGTDQVLTVVMDGNKTFEAHFALIPDCQRLTPETVSNPTVSINDAIAAAGLNRPAYICPDPGLYENGTVEVEGKIRIELE